MQKKYVASQMKRKEEKAKQYFLIAIGEKSLHLFTMMHFPNKFSFTENRKKIAEKNSFNKYSNEFYMNEISSNNHFFFSGFTHELMNLRHRRKLITKMRKNTQYL